MATKGDDERESENATICQQPLMIPTASPEEVWRYINRLTSFDYVYGLLKERLDNNFFGFGKHISELTKAKLIYNTEHSSNEADNIEIHHVLAEKGGIKSNAKEITLLSRQAIELYQSSQAASIYSRPITLYYSYTKLARVLFLATYKSEETSGTHGLSLKDNNSIVCQKRGAFARFHDSYSWNPSIYLNGCMFSWRDFIHAEQQKIDRYQLILNMKKCNAVYLNERRSKDDRYLEHELTREIIFCYAMSMLARYRVELWGTLIEAEHSSLIWNIQDYLTSTQTLFPNLVFNQLHGRQYYFYPVEPEWMLLTEVVPQKIDWIL
jgi:hypothetical protein